MNPVTCECVRAWSGQAVRTLRAYLDASTVPMSLNWCIHCTNKHILETSRSEQELLQARKVNDDTGPQAQVKRKCLLLLVCSSLSRNVFISTFLSTMGCEAGGRGDPLATHCLGG